MKLSPAQSLAFLLFLTLSAHAQEARRGLPWKAFGKVTDPEGRPLAGVNVWASCGMGTLRRTGSATSGEDGRYELSFGPGILVQVGSDLNVPEPATWAMMLVGIGMAGAIMRARRSLEVSAA